MGETSLNHLALPETVTANEQQQSQPRTENPQQMLKSLPEAVRANEQQQSQPPAENPCQMLKYNASNLSTLCLAALQNRTCASGCGEVDSKLVPKHGCSH